MSPLQRFADALAHAISHTGPFAPGILFFATFVEYVFPPFPGDVLVVLGAWYVVQGEISWLAAFVSLTAGAVVGAWIDYRVGAFLGRRLERRASHRSPLSQEKLARFEASYRRWGALVLLGNRFLPGVRAFVFFAAGAAGIPLAKTLLLGATSSALWTAALLGAGVFLARNVDDLVEIVDQYTRGVWIAMGAVAMAAAAVAWVRRRRRAARAAEGR